MSSASLLPNGYFNKLDVNRLSALQLKVGKKVPPESSDPTNEPSWLFSLDISEASYDANQYTLTFKKSNVNIIRFSDRPFRIATTESVNDLEELFSENTENSFKEDPPNGVLVMKQGQLAFEILTMSVKDGIVRYVLRSLSNENFVSESGKMSFFIDNATSSSTVGLTSTPSSTVPLPPSSSTSSKSIASSTVTINNTTSITLTGYTFTNCDFKISGKKAVYFYACQFTNCQFKGQNLSGFVFGTVPNTTQTNTILTNTLIENCDLTSAYIYAQLPNTTITYCVVTRANIQDTYVKDSNNPYNINNIAVNTTVAGYSTNLSLSGITPIDYKVGGWNFTTTDLPSDKNLKHAYLVYANLSGANFSGVDLTDAILTGANLSGASITGANFSGTTITWTQIQETANWNGRGNEGNTDYIAQKDLSGITFPSGFDFSNAILTGANLTGATITGANFSNATITWEQLTATQNGIGVRGSYYPLYFRGITFPSGFDFSGKNLTSKDTNGVIHGANFANANLTGANFKNANLTLADFTGATLTDAIITGVNLTNATITWARIQETANWKGLGKESDNDYIAPLYFKGITFSKGFDFSGKNLTSTDTNGANFANANLTGANFKNANLTGANFKNANLTLADFTGATLSGCDFTNAQNVNTAKFDNATIHGTYSIGDTIQSPNQSDYIYRNPTTSGYPPTWKLLTPGAKFLGNGTNTGGVTDGFTFGQLQKTSSYQNGDLTGVHVNSVSNPDGAYSAETALHVISSFAFAHFTNCILRNLDLTRCDAAYSSFYNTTIQYTIFSFYSGAKFNSATNFYSADLYGATIQNANLISVNWLSANMGIMKLGSSQVSYATQNETYALDTRGNRYYAITQAQKNVIHQL
jgi:uncharacterized protein YjbI with pentapeptide repeats